MDQERTCGSLFCDLLQGNCPCRDPSRPELTRSQADREALRTSTVKVSGPSCKVAFSEASAHGEVVAEFPSSTKTGRGFLAKKTNE